MPIHTDPNVHLHPSTYHQPRATAVVMSPIHCQSHGTAVVATAQTPPCGQVVGQPQYGSRSMYNTNPQMLFNQAHGHQAHGSAHVHVTQPPVHPGHFHR